MISLSSLQPSQERHRPKRVGRGNASGKGTTAGRGTKGQRARTGGRNKLIRKGLKHLIERTPKTSGYLSLRTKLAEVQLADLSRVFADAQAVGPSDMLKAGLVETTWPGVKVIGSDPIKKKLSVTANSFSKAASAAIIKAGGSVTVIPKPTPRVKKVYVPETNPRQSVSRKVRRAKR